MNLLFISNDPSIFDEATSVRARMRAYAVEVAKTGGTLHILSSAPNTQDIVDGSLFLYGMHVPKWRRIGVLSHRAKKLIAEHRIDVVSAQDPFEHGLVALRAVQASKKGTSGKVPKLHVQVHTDFLSPWFTRGSIARAPKVAMPIALNRIRQRMAGKVLQHADGIRVVSNRIKDSLVAKYGESMQKATVIPIQVPDQLPPAVLLPSHTFSFVLMCVGRLEPEKRIEDILLAIAQLKASYSMLGLMVVGEGGERAHLEKFAAQYDVGDRVMFLGNRPDALGLMQNAQAFIQASAYEGYGRTLIEAALARLPIITTDVGIVGDVFKGYENVLSAPPGDPAQLAYNIRWLLEDQRARSELAMSAERAARAHLASVHTSPADVIGDIARLAV